MEFKDRLKKYRADNNLTQEELAAKLCVSRQAVSKYETGLNYPNLDVMKDISELLGVSLDELLSKEEIAKEAITANVNRQKNKRNVFLLIIAIALVVAISVTAIVLSVISSQTPADDGLVLVGLVGDFSGKTPNMQMLDEGKLFGYCYTFQDGMWLGKGYNLAGLHSSFVNVEPSADSTWKSLFEINSSFDMNVIVSSKASECYLYSVYYDDKTDEYLFRSDYVINAENSALVHIKKGKQDWNFSLNFKRVDELKQITLYEFAMGGAQIKNAKFDGETEYTISNDCLYVVIEEEFVDASGRGYFNRKIIENSQINNTYVYSLPMLDANGYGTQKIYFKK